VLISLLSQPLKKINEKKLLSEMKSRERITFESVDRFKAADQLSVQKKKMLIAQILDGQMTGEAENYLQSLLQKN